MSSVALKSMNAAMEAAKANPEYPSKGEVHVCYDCKICAMMLKIVVLGYDRCKTRLNQECISHYCPLFIWKVRRVYMYIVCNILILLHIYTAQRLLVYVH